VCSPPQHQDDDDDDDDDATREIIEETTDWEGVIPVGFSGKDDEDVPDGDDEE
jgi:hypothetical protein